MRQKLNENPIAQIALIGVLVVIVGYFLLSGLGGSGGEESGSTEETAVTSESPATEGGLPTATPAAATSSTQAPSGGKLPAAVEAAYENGKTIVLFIYRPGGIDDKLTAEATQVLHQIPDTQLFTTRIDHIARYAPITGPLGVSQAPALIVIRNKEMNGGGVAPATVSYGFQTAEDIRQAIIDSRYRGSELPYAPK